MLDQEVQGAFSFTVNENNIINDTNFKTSKVNITLADGRVEEDTAFDLYYVNAAGVDTEIVANDLKIAQYANESGKVTVSFAKLINLAKDGETKNITLKLKIADSDEVVATTVVTVNRIHPEAVKISARRDGTEKAALKFQAQSGSDIVKVYYIIDTAAKAKETDVTANKNVKVASVENNQFDAVLDWDSVLTNNTKYVVNFVVENAVGNQSKLKTAVVPNDSSAKKEEKVTNVKISDDLKPTWTAPSSAPTSGYKIIVYNEAGEVVGEVDATSSGEQALSSVIKEAGKYSITVVSKGNDDGSTIASDETEPVEFEVTQLKEVTGIKFVVDEEDPSKVKLNWDEYADKENSAFDGYTINIYAYDTATGDYKATSVTSKNNIDKDATEIDLKDVSSSTFTASANIRYKAEIIANAKSNQEKVLSSVPAATTKDYFKVSVSIASSDITDNSVKIKLKNGAADKAKFESLGSKVTYDLQVWKESESATAEKHYELAETKENVAMDENGVILVDNLTQGLSYKFALIVHIDGGKAEGISAKATVAVKKTLPSMLNLEVIKTAPSKLEDTVGKIYTDGSTKLLINGEEVLISNATKYYDPQKLLDGSYALNLINSLNTGDSIISLTEEKVTIKAGEIATNGTAREIKAGGRILEIQGNKYEQDVKSLVADAKEVILTGEGAIFKLDTTSTSTIKVSDGVKLVSKDTSAVKVIILANATATVNEVDISSSGDLEISETLNTKHELKIKSAGNNTINIDNHSKKELEVTFMDEAAIGEFQLGKITINSNANIVIKSNTGSQVKADISVSTENGSIDISDSNLVGAKNVIVSTNKDSAKTTIKANTKLKAPINLKGIEIMNYTVDQLKALKTKNKTIEGSKLTKEMLSDCSTDEDYQAIVDYFNAFGSKLQAFGKATVTATKNKNAVTITIPAKSELTLADIGGLK